MRGKTLATQKKLSLASHQTSKWTHVAHHGTTNSTHPGYPQIQLANGKARGEGDGVMWVGNEMKSIGSVEKKPMFPGLGKGLAHCLMCSTQ